MWNLTKMIQKKLLIKQNVTDFKTNHMVTIGGTIEGREKLGGENNIYTLLHKRDDYQEPTIWYREIYSIVCNNIYGKKNEYMYKRFTLMNT